MKKKYLMKNKKAVLLIFILILYFSFIFQETNTIFYRKNEESNRDIKINLSKSNSHEYEWYRTWEGHAYDVAVDSTNDVYVVGNIELPNFPYTRNVTLLKFDSSGVQQWNRTWGNEDDDEYSRHIALDSVDNVYIPVIVYEKGMILVKYDKYGVLQWNRTLDAAGGIAVDSLDNVYCADSFVTEPGNEDMLLVKYDNDGILQWNRTWGMTDIDFPLDMAIDSTDNIYLTGVIEDARARKDMVLVKFDNSGIYQWNRTWGGSGNNDYSYDVATDSLGNVYITGLTYSFGAGLTDIVLIKYDSFGELQWNRTYGGSDFDNGYGVAVDSLDNVYITGEIDGGTPMALIKYNSHGEQEWINTFSIIGESIQGEGIALDSFDNVYIAARSPSLLVKYSKIPEIMIYSPLQNELFGSVAPTFNISILEPNLDSTWYSLDGGLTNISFSGQIGTIDQTEWKKLMSGEVTIHFYAKNSLTKVGYSEVIISKDIDNPKITIKYPSQGEHIGDEAPNYDISIIEPNLESIWYTIDNGITNFSIIHETGTINQTAWEAASYSSIQIEFWAKDLAGNIGHSEVIVEKVKKEEPAIPGYNLVLLISLISIITVISRKKKYI